MQTQDQYQE